MKDYIEKDKVQQIVLHIGEGKNRYSVVDALEKIQDLPVRELEALAEYADIPIGGGFVLHSDKYLKVRFGESGSGAVKLPECDFVYVHKNARVKPIRLVVEEKGGES